MVQSMTGFANLHTNHEVGPTLWQAVWDIRAVNGRGLDLRMRLPDWVTGLEPAARKAVQARVARGSVTLSLRLDRPVDEAAALNVGALRRLMERLDFVQAEAREAGVDLAPPTTLDLLMQRGLADMPTLTEAETADLSRRLQADLPALLDAFTAARAVEGQGLLAVLRDQLSTIDGLITQADAALPDRTERQRSALSTALHRVTDLTEVDPVRLTQELALLAVKSDVTEELDRLRVHLDSARAMLAEGAPVGRKLDFLCQEFNRESNTLCSKSNDSALTDIGLRLKISIDQLREQIQNVE